HVKTLDCAHRDHVPREFRCDADSGVGVTDQGECGCVVRATAALMPILFDVILLPGNQRNAAGIRCHTRTVRPSAGVHLRGDTTTAANRIPRPLCPGIPASFMGNQTLVAWRVVRADEQIAVVITGGVELIAPARCREEVAADPADKV